MEFRKRVLCVCLLLMTLSSLALPVSASSTHMEHEGLEITVQMDKEEYDDTEPITATIVVENTSGEVVTITNLEQLIPEGYVLSENSEVSAENLELLPQELVVLQVTFEKAASETEAAAPEDFFGKILFGETWGLPNVLLIMILIIAVIIFMILT